MTNKSRSNWNIANAGARLVSSQLPAAPCISQAQVQVQMLFEDALGQLKRTLRGSGEGVPVDRAKQIADSFREWCQNTLQILSETPVIRSSSDGDVQGKTTRINGPGWILTTENINPIADPGNQAAVFVSFEEV